MAEHTGADRRRLLTLFEQLVSFDSPSFGEREICDFLKEKLSDLGLTVQEDDTAEKISGSCGNLFGQLAGTLDLPPLLFCAHMDTVEPSRGKRMQTDDTGKITSGGNTVLGADDCSGLAAILEALAVIQETGLPHRPIEILFCPAEETYGDGSRHFDYSRLHSKEAYVLDLTGPVGAAAYQAPMILSFTATFWGRAAHAGFAPENGIHAIKAAALALSRTPCGRIDDTTTVNIGIISGGTQTNIVPEQCTLSGEIRSLSDDGALVQLVLISHIMEEAANELGATVEFQHTIHIHAYRTDPSHPVVKRFETACSSLGLPLSLEQTFGGSDNNHIAQHGISGIVIANAMNACHSCEEYTTEEELERIANLTLTLMLSKE